MQDRATNLFKPAHLIGHILGIATASGVLLLIVSHVGQWSKIADFSNHVLPITLPFLSVLACIHITYLIRKRRPMALPFVLSCMIIVSLGRFILPELINKPILLKQDESYRLVVFNVLKTNAHYEGVAQWLNHNAVDFAVLLEADKTLIDTITDQFPYSVNCLGNKGSCSTVILSKMRPQKSIGHATYDPQNRKSLSASETQFCLDETPVSLIAVHLSRPWGEQQRDLQHLKTIIQQRQEMNVIAAGDFNLTPWSFRLRQFDQDIFLNRITRALPTWPANSIIPSLFPIDHIYTSSQIYISSVYPDNIPGSDHRPIIMDFSLPRPNVKTIAKTTEPSC